MSLALRPYQTAARDELRAKYRAGARWVLLVMPTGAGKTVSAVDIIETAVRRGKRVLFAANRMILVEQTSRHLDAAGLKDHGVLMSNHWRTRRSAPVQVASVATMLRRQYFPPADLVVLDEAHYSRSRGYEDLKKAYPNAYGLGLSATPFRVDGKSLGGFFDDFVIGESIGGLIEKKFLVPPRVFAPTTPNFARLRTHGVRGDFREEDLGREMDRPSLTGNIVNHWLKLGQGKRTVAFASTVAHSQHLAQRFLEKGVPAEHLDGGSTLGEREAVLGRHTRGETLVVSSCGVLSEGWDSPPTECAILARPTQSLALYIQQVGRVLRPSPGKSEALILDHAGNTLRHGFVTDEFSVNFREDVEPPDRGGDGVSRARKCPKCFCLMAVRTERCPHCGFVFATPDLLREGEGELYEIQHGAGRPPFGEQLVFWRECVRIGNARASTTRSLVGWAKSRFMEKFGFAPTVIGTDVVDPTALTVEQQHALWMDIEKTRVERGWRSGWSHNEYRRRTGHYPRAEIAEAVA